MSDEPRPSVRQIFDEHARYIWRTLRHLGIPEAEAPDLCQEVFVIVHRRLSSFEGRSSLRTWLYGICIRVASEYRRRPHVRKETPLLEPASESEQQASSPDSALEQRNAVQHLLAMLDDDKRQVVVLYEIEGFSMKEVAEIIECPLQTAYSRLHAARALMLSALNAEKAAQS